MNEILIVTSHAPYSGLQADDALDAALAASNVGLRVSFLFERHGVFQLLLGQQKDATVNQLIEKRMKALPMFDIEDIYYCKQSADQLLPKESVLSTIAKPLVNQTDIERLIDAHQHVLRF
jgi:tRNA 2-thiouridine synthesizing protein C